MQLAVAFFLAPVAVAPVAQEKTVAVRAGTIHLVEDGTVLTGGATLVMRDGRIVDVGTDVQVPPSAKVIDYGSSAVIVPGLVCANSSIGLTGQPPVRTAAPDNMAVDSFDPYASYVLDISGGVTTVYVPPARFRLIAGQGAVVKLAGEPGAERILSSSAAIQGSITAESREVPGYWEPPVPATEDVGLGVALPQLPRSTMGAILALGELVALARGGDDDGRYGTSAGPVLAELVRANKPWRMGADSRAEIRALLGFFAEQRLPLLLDGARDAADVADEIAAAGVTVLVEVDISPNETDRRLGTDEEAAWPRYDAAARLAAKGVPIAIQPAAGLRPRDLFFAAAVASREGLDPEAALEAITLGPARALGVDARVGSLAPGKDADFVVLSGAPLGSGTAVLATWISGESRFEFGSLGTKNGSSSASAHAAARSVVIAVDELHLGDGHVLRPGQIAIQNGRIIEVGEGVGVPPGAEIVHGRAAMPGVVDALGHLGLEGSSKVPAVEFKLGRLVEPGDHTDRRVAKAGVTTVVLAARGPSNAGTPMMAYKPAGTDVESMIVKDPVAVRLTWKDQNRLEAGKAVRDLLEKAREYKKKWDEYEKALSTWDPSKAEEEEPKKAEGEGEKKPEEAEKKEEEKPEEKKEEKKDEKKKEEEAEVDPLNGIWEADVVVPPYVDPAHLRLRLEREGPDGPGGLGGNLRCDTVSDSLVTLNGTWVEEGEEKKKTIKIDVSGLGSRGVVQVQGTIAKEELTGTLLLGGTSVTLTAKRTERELKHARRPERTPEKKEEPKPKKGEPKSPGIDPKLEPLRQAMLGNATVVVDVDRSDEIIDCVAAFEQSGIKPVLYGAEDAHEVAASLKGRVDGVMLSPQVFRFDEDGGLASMTNRYAELAAAGIRIVFHSDAEEGAAELLLRAAYTVANGLGASVGLRALTADVADMMRIADRVGRLQVGLDGDVLLLDGPPLAPSTRVLRAWVGGKEVQ